jgi:hypothetical protein
MTTPQTNAHIAHRLRIRPATPLTALGVLVAIAVSILILALTHAHRTATGSPVTPSQAAGGSVPELHYLGPRQVGAGREPQTARVHGDATAQYRCLPEKFCVRVR